jgi:hypothetical protein
MIVGLDCSMHFIQLNINMYIIYVYLLRLLHGEFFWSSNGAI